MGPKFIASTTITISAYDFLLNFNRNYASILYHFRVIAILFVESEQF